MITFVLLIAALVCFILATLGVVVAGRIAFGWLGAALITVTLLIGAYPGAGG